MTRYDLGHEFSGPFVIFHLAFPTSRMTRFSVMELELRLRILLEGPPPGVDFGLQLGHGTDYETIQKQQFRGKDVSFDFSVTVKDNRADGLPNFLGPLTQGP